MKTEKVEDTHMSENLDYIKLSKEDKKIIKEIDSLLKKLSENGHEYWQTYYG